MGPCLPSTRSVCQERTAHSTDVAVWSGYNSLITDKLPLTRLGTLHVIGTPAHEWQIFLTVLMPAQDIKTKVVRLTSKTVISQIYAELNMI